MFVAAGRAGIMRSIASPSTAIHDSLAPQPGDIVAPCPAGSSRGGPRSSTPPRCAGSCRR